MATILLNYLSTFWGEAHRLDLRKLADSPLPVCARRFLAHAVRPFGRIRFEWNF
jgi:hypothetical protein